MQLQGDYSETFKQSGGLDKWKFSQRMHFLENLWILSCQGQKFRKKIILFMSKRDVGIVSNDSLQAKSTRQAFAIRTID